jgi:riboflavin synthase
MFTGLVQAVGTVVSASGGRFEIECPWGPASIAKGASIACDGCCLTAISITPNPGDGCIFALDASHETLSRTTLGVWRAGRRINLERSLRAGDELGGHLVSGHVDGVARILAITPAGSSRMFEIEAPADFARFLAPKGSVALDGVSLTVNEVAGAVFSVNLIPHTLSITTFGHRQPGDSVNFEVDMIARYVARLMAK